MKEIGVKGKRWLKGFHVTFACLWVGGGLTLTLMQLAMHATIGGELYGIDRSMKFIDDFIIIPGALGSLLTGLLYSLFTNWGFFKHNWITVKWVINIGGIIFGTFWLGHWMNGMPPISETYGLGALSNPIYDHYKHMNTFWGSVQVTTLVFALFVSVFKPWSLRKAN